ncbi:MAG: PKD domain-containing protein [Candidatus Lernaella stagnicola]|nr:PKD domain-containing protein [Candidatus Lernaella stagnicola]
MNPKRLSLYLFLLCALIGGLMMASNASAGWVIEDVAASGDQGNYASIAVDSTRTIHTAWYDAGVGRLLYSVRQHNGWQTVQVDAGNRGMYASIDINPLNDLPAIAYYAQEDNRPKYAWFDGEAWHTEFIGGATGDIEGDFIDLAFKATGLPYVSYHFDDGAFNDMGLKVGYRDSAGSWHVSGVDTATSSAGMSQFGEHTAIAFSSGDNPHVAYQGDNVFSPQQKYAWYAAGSWDFTVTFDFDFAGIWSDIALDSGDNPYISTWNTETLGQECAAVIFEVADEWTLDNIECGDGDFGAWTSIAIDGNDNLHVAYYGAGELRYALGTASGWTIVTLDDNGGDGNTGAYTTIALDDRGSPYIGYYNQLQKDMMITYLLDPPDVFSITPAEGNNNAVLEDVAIVGDLFETTSTVRLVTPDSKVQVPGTSVVVTSRTNLVCDFDLSDVPVGVYNLEVTNIAGAGVLPDAFTVITDPPDLDSISPEVGANDDDDFTIQLTGTHFTPDMTVTLTRSNEDDMTPTDFVVYNATSAAAVFDLTNALTGEWNVVVETTFGGDTLNNAFTVICGLPAANFDALPKQGQVPLEVQFADRSEATTYCDLTTWAWVFGDGETSAAQRPKHTYQEPGSYDVSLTVTNDGGSDYVVKSAFITVNAPGDDDTTDDDTADDDDATDDDDDDASDDDDLSPPPDDEGPARADEEDDSKSEGSCGC